ncbi:hypothetical protein [Burkholderia ubonensis]|nr:hypothetical protein [Burkholderia ubonensis]
MNKGITSSSCLTYATTPGSCHSSNDAQKNAPDEKNYGMRVMDRRVRQTRDLLGGKTDCRIHKRFTDFDRHQLPDRKLLIWQLNSSGECRRFNN